MDKRTLGLKRERLTELSAADLASVYGGEASGLTCPILECVSEGPTCLDCITRTCF